MSSGLTGYLLSDGTDLSNVFMNINKGASLSLANKFTSTNTFKGNIDLSGSFLYGRNDGYNFREVISAPFPIGYIIDNSNIFVTKDISCSSLIDVGTWIANCSASVTEASNATTPGSYTTSSLFSISLEENANIKYSNPEPKNIYPIPSTIPINLNIRMQLVSVLFVSAPTTLTLNASLTNSSTNMRINIYLGITKIA